jgi:hypothetical protein
LAGSSFQVAVDAETLASLSEAIGIRAWVMDPTTGRDGVGWWPLAAEAEVAGTNEAPVATPARAEVEVESTGRIEADDETGDLS